MRIREGPCVAVGDGNYGHLVIFWRRKTQNHKNADEWPKTL